jgi:hypothetical protein
MLEPTFGLRHSVRRMTVGLGRRDAAPRNYRPRHTFAIQGRKRSFGHGTEQLQSADCVGAPDLDGDCHGCGCTAAASPGSTGRSPCRARATSGARCTAPHGCTAAALRGSRPAYRSTGAARCAATYCGRATTTCSAGPASNGAAYRRAADSAACRGRPAPRPPPGDTIATSRDAAWHAATCRGFAWFAA